MKHSVSWLIGVGLLVITGAVIAAEKKAPDSESNTSSLTRGAFVRPAIQLADEKARSFHSKWQDCIERSDFEGILGARTSDGDNAKIEIENGIMPWITLAEDQDKPYSVVPGGLKNRDVVHSIQKLHCTATCKMNRAESALRLSGRKSIFIGPFHKIFVRK